MNFDDLHFLCTYTIEESASLLTSAANEFADAEKWNTLFKKVVYGAITCDNSSKSVKVNIFWTPKQNAHQRFFAFVAWKCILMYKTFPPPDTHTHTHTGFGAFNLLDGVQQLLRNSWFTEYQIRPIQKSFAKGADH